MTPSSPEYTYSEQPAIHLFQKLGYQYAHASQTGNERQSTGDTVLKNRLQSALKRINPWLNQNNLNVALRNITAVPGTSLIDINHNIHHLLQGSEKSVKQAFNGKQHYKNIHYIDYQNIHNNDFLVVNQMRFKGKGAHSVPDIVVFVNGLPIAVLECKAPTLENACSHAVNDLHYYQRNSPKLFHHNQICAALYKVGAKYGAILAGEIHYNPYKLNHTQPISQLLDHTPTPQDILLYQLFKKENLLDIIRNFIIFETAEGKKIKKLPRYPQIRTVNKAVHKLQTEDKGGVIWHTQGSGKSISMVYLASKLRREEEALKNPTIIVMTDRVDLDTQISDTFGNCGFKNAIQAKSIYHLGTLLRDTYGKTIMTTLQKFQETDENGNPLKNEDNHQNDGSVTHTKRHIEPNGQLVKITVTKDADGKIINRTRRVIDVPQLSIKENVYVFVDEAHRSHYGFLAGFMRRALPNAKFFAFTGTPIDKAEKSTLAEFYGGKYLDTYTIKESVADGATLPIYYEAGLPNLYVDKDLIDRQFEQQFKDQSGAKKEKLRQKASGLSTYMNARERILAIAKAIIRHYKEKIHPDGFKAMVVCHSREAAANYRDAFLRLEEKDVHKFKTQVIMSLDTKKDPARFSHLATHPDDIKQAIEHFKLPFGDENETARDGKKLYDNTAITIVCDMLLTGYDVPVVQVMYLDKLLMEHNLLQAIARVNRTRAGKKAGFIVDYCGITSRLNDALAMFSEDLKAHEVMEKTGAEAGRLERRCSALRAFFGTVKADGKTQRDEYIDLALQFLEPEDLRDRFNALLKKFNTSINILLPREEALAYDYDFKLYNEIKYQAANMYPDDSPRISPDESRKIQQLVDDHLHASGIRYLLDAPISIMDREKFEEEINKSLSPKSRELKIINRIKYIIRINLHKDPDFYKPLSERLEALIKMRKDDRMQQMELFRELEQMQDSLSGREAEIQRLGFKNEGQLAVYNTLKTHLKEDAARLTLSLFDSLADEFQIVDWETKEGVQKTMRRKIKGLLGKGMSLEKKDSLANAIVSILISNTKNVRA